MRKYLISIVLALTMFVSVFSFVGCDGKYKLSDKNANNYFYEQDIYHDQAYTFMEPLQPTAQDNVTLRLKVKRGLAKEVNIKYSFDIKSSATDAEFYTAPMVFEEADTNLAYDYWVGIIPANEANYRYHFELKNN